jgi:hypothetical protein
LIEKVAVEAVDVDLDVVDAVDVDMMEELPPPTPI